MRELDGLTWVLENAAPYQQYCVTATFSWSSLSYHRQSVTILGNNRHETMVKALKWAIKDGWTPKRWWKFWRWDDTPNPDKALISEAMEARD